MERSDYDKQLLRWVRDHYWDSLDKDKDLILRHLRTFAGDEDASQPNKSTGQTKIETPQFPPPLCRWCQKEHMESQPCQ